MKVSIVIDNYNYGRFLGAAIESALAQTWPDTEVIVVDDGSTDDSRAVIDRYAGRVIPLYKENGGQASAFNLGLERSTGQLVILLDADDILYPTRAARVVERYRPGVVKIQCQLDTIDRDGRNLDMTFPHFAAGLSPAEIRRRLFAFGEYTSAPASGNAFSREYLGRVIPIPLAYRYNADGYLNVCAPLYGDVETIGEPLGAYRVHGANNLAKEKLSSSSYKSHVGYDLLMRRSFLSKAAELGYAVDERRLPFSKNHLEDRMLSLRVAPDRHQVPDDTLGRLVRLGLRSTWTAPDINILGRILWSIWLIVIGFMPLGVVSALVKRFRLQNFRTRTARALIAMGRRHN